MSDYTGSSFISQPVEEELTGLETLISDNSNAISTNAANLAQEIIDRGNADTGLQTQINDRALQTALATEASTRLQADEALSTRITTNSNAISTNAANLAQEIIDRGNADTGLQTQINERALQTALATEASTRLQADEALSTRITINSNAISTNAANLAQEIIDRGNADTGLQNQINERALQMAAIDDRLTTEIATRTADDLALGTRITTNSNAISTDAANLAQEIIDREQADTALENDINDRALILSLTNETTARTAADDALGARIDFEKTTTAYYISNLQGQIDVNETAIETEETARQAADTTLQASITTNATAIGTKANDTDVVKLFSNQNIAGEKFFTNDTRIGGDVILPTDEGKIVLGANTDRKIYWTAEGLGTNHAFQATRYDVAGGEQIASNNLADVNTLVKTTGDQSIAGVKTFENDTYLNNNVYVASDAGNIYLGTNNDRRIFRTITGIRTMTTMDASQYNVNGTQIASTNLGDVTSLVKTTGDQSIGGIKTFTDNMEIDGDVNLTAGKAYKIDNVIIPTHADLNLKAPIDNADLTGHTQMDRLTVNHSDSATIGLDFNNTNSNQYAGKFNTAAYGWRMFNNNTGIAGNTTFGVYTKGTGSQLNPLLVKNDGKIYTLDQEVDGDVNLSAGKAYKIDNVPIPTNDDLALKAPIDNASLTGNTEMTRLTVNHSDSASIGLDFNNTNNNQYAGKFNTSAYGWRMFNNNTSIPGNTTFGVYTKGTGSQLNPLLVKNDGKLYTLDQEVDGDVNLTTGHEFKVNGVPISGGMTPEQVTQLDNTTARVDDLYDITPVTLTNIRFSNSIWSMSNFNTIVNIQDAMAVGQVPQDRITNLPADLAAKRAITDTSFNQFQLNGTTQYMTAAGGTINATDYFTEFDLTGLVNTDLVVGIQETDILYQTKCIFIKTDDPSNTNGNLIIRSNYLLSDQDIILRKKGDCVFLHADWDSSRWKVLGVFSNVQQSLTTTQNIVSEMNIICHQNLMSNSAEPTYITGFSNINLRTPDTGSVPTISIDGQEAFMTKATNQTISGIKTFSNGIVADLNISQTVGLQSALDEKQIRYLPCLIEHHENSGVDGGASAATQWNDVVLNTIDDTLRTDFTIAANSQITIAAIGTYEVSFSVASYSTLGTKAELIGVTDNAKVVHGTSFTTTNASGGMSNGMGVITTTQANEVFKLRLYTEGSGLLGKAVSSGSPETYAQVFIKRLS